jgi:hypothetical protein
MSMSSEALARADSVQSRKTHRQVCLQGNEMGHIL